MKEKENKVKEIRIPRLAVYLIALFAAIVICFGMSLTFGVAYAAEFSTVAIFNCVIAFVAYNIIDKWDEQPWRLTPSYWVEEALIVLADVLFILTAKSKSAFAGGSACCGTTAIAIAMKSTWSLRATACCILWRSDAL